MKFSFSIFVFFQMTPVAERIPHFPSAQKSLADKRTLLIMCNNCKRFCCSYFTYWFGKQISGLDGSKIWELYLGNLLSFYVFALFVDHPVDLRPSKLLRIYYLTSLITTTSEFQNRLSQSKPICDNHKQALQTFYCIQSFVIYSVAISRD